MIKQLVITDDKRVFVVGDLIDKGVDNLKCVELLDKGWFINVRGNHEQFCIDSLNDPTIAYYHKMRNNGGGSCD